MFMKFRTMLCLIGVISVLSGCGRIRAAADRIEETVLQAAEPTVFRVSREQALSIALDHAGLTSDQVTGLRTEYDTEHGYPEYDVEFRYGKWEYDYEIDAETGEILSFSMDD